MTEEVVDATPVEEIGTDVVPVAPQQPTTLFGTNDPAEVLESAGKVAAALKAALTSQGMVSNIQGREHVRVEGWQTLGSMLGVVPVLTWTRETPDGWEARVEARTLDGRVVGAAEAMCTRKERTWKSRDDYALRSMAQTRATSKALRGPLGFVVTLAGYEATPAEEMPADAGPARSDVPADPMIGRETYDTLKELFATAGNPAEGLVKLLDEGGVPPQENLAHRIRDLTVPQAEWVTDWLTHQIEAKAAKS